MGPKAKLRREDVKRFKELALIADNERRAEAGLLLGAIGTKDQQKWTFDRWVLKSRAQWEIDFVPLLVGSGQITTGEGMNRVATVKAEVEKRLAELGEFPGEQAPGLAPEAPPPTSAEGA